MAVAQASGRGREFTRKLSPFGRVGHLGCARSWLLWHTLSLQRISMAPYTCAPCCARAHRRYERVCGIAGEVTRWRRAQRAVMRIRGGQRARAGGAPQGRRTPQGPNSSFKRTRLNWIRRPERGGCKGPITGCNPKTGVVGGCYNPSLGCNNHFGCNKPR